jgi:HAE1 family hydrophobic/amphiphilic exporter-1
MAAGVPAPASAADVRQMTLEEALALVPQGSRAVARADEYGAQVVGRYREERAAAFPQFNLSAGTTRQHDPWQGNPDWREERVTLDVSQPLYTWGKLSAAIRAAEIGLQTAEARRRAARQGALAEVAAAFADVLLAHDLEAIARRDLEQKEARRDEAQRRLAAGVVTEYDLLVTQVVLENARPELIRRSNQVEISREHLRFLLALTEEVDVLGPLPLEFPPLPSFDEAREAALRDRPDLAELRQRIAMAAELVTIARTGNRPRIDVKGSAGYLWSDVSGSAEEGELWQAGLYLNWPVFDGLRSSGRTMQAESELRALRIDEAEQLDNLTVQVREALNAAGEAEAIVRALADTEKQARQLLDMAEKGLEYGVKIRLDVADAELNLLQAQANLARARRDYFVARTHLRWVMGELGEERQGAQAAR